MSEFPGRTHSHRQENQKHIENLHSLGLLPKKAVSEARTYAGVGPPGGSSKDRAPSSTSHLTNHEYQQRHTAPRHQTDLGSTAVARDASRRQHGAKRHLGYASVDRGYLAPSHSQTNQTSFNWRSGRPSAGMMEIERQRTRRERTFIGSECAVCEEPLEHTLRGERILQFSCGHVSHEACFYEYIKEFDSQYCPTCNAPLGLDTSRGGNVLDLEKLSNIVRSVDGRDPGNRSSQHTPTPWDQQTGDRPPSRGSGGRYRDSKDSRGYSNRDSGENNTRQRIERYGSTLSVRTRDTQGTHGRQNSQGTGYMSQGQYDEGLTNRKHDYDLVAMESDLHSPRAGSMTKNPIPPPVVTVRSEYPTLTRSKHSQVVTCLVTVEVPEGKWVPDPDDIRSAPPAHHAPHPEKEVISGPGRGSEDRVGWSTESREELDETTEDLHARVDNWHGLDFARFGKLRLHGTLRVSRDRASWQELECFLFAEMLICIKEKRGVPPVFSEGSSKRKLTKCTLRGSILIKKHLKDVEQSPNEPILTLSLAVNELPQFHLQFTAPAQVAQWKRSLLDLNNPQSSDVDQDLSGTDDEDYRTPKGKRVSSMNSSWGAGRSVNTAPTEYTAASGMDGNGGRLPPPIHVPLDIVAVIPISSSMQGLKISLLRDSLRFLVQNMGARDRMGLVTFGSSGGAVPLVGMTTKVWSGWNKVLNSIKPVGQKSIRADVVEGANVAMDLLMQRKSSNPIATILLISDSSTADAESVDFVIQRAEAAKIAIHSFGLGLTHKPDTMIELSTRTKASYTYVKDWMMLRECVAGCLGALQTVSHQNAKLKLRLPEGSPAKFAKIAGALQITKRTAGREAEAAVGDLRFGDKRDILVQLVIAPDTSSEENLPQDSWDSIVSGLEALGGGYDRDEDRTTSIEEVPLLQADLVYGDILREGSITQLSRPSLLAITLLPVHPKDRKNTRPVTPPIPPHPHIVQRRMELLTSDMLSRALFLVSRGQHDRAQHLLNETRSILKGLAKGGLPPIPPTGKSSVSQGKDAPNTPRQGSSSHHQGPSKSGSISGSGGSGNGGQDASSSPERQPSPSQSEASASTFTAPGIDTAALHALDSELESSLEWIGHPAVFGRDSRKAVLQAIGVISSQRGYTFRTPAESLWANRVAGVKKLTARSQEWREVREGETLAEEN